MAASAYSDHNATSPLRPAAFESMVEVLRGRRQPVVRPCSRVRKARAVVEAARRQVAAPAGALPAEAVLYFAERGQQPGAFALAAVGYRFRR